jgi:dCTP deaminase
MAILPDSELKKIVKEKNAVYVDQGPEIDEDLQIGPSSMDLRLGYEFGILNTRKIEMVDTKDMKKYSDYMKKEQHSAEEGVIVHPGEFILGGTLETVNVPSNLVARVEGRSSYGRLGIIVHASLPYDERILHWDEENGYRFLEIGEIIEEELKGYAVSFDPETKEVSKFRITDFIENPPKDIYKVKTEKGREVKITEDHNLFTLNENGEIEKVKTQKVKGELIAVPRKIETSEEVPEVELINLLNQEGLEEDVMISERGVVENTTIQNPEMEKYYRENDTAPLKNVSEVGQQAKLSFKQSTAEFPQKIKLDEQFAYTAGLFLAEGYQRRKQLIFSNKNKNYLGKVKDYFNRFDTIFYEKTGQNNCTQLTISSAFLSKTFEALELADKRIGDKLLDMPENCLEQLYQGLIDGDAAIRGERVEYYTSNKDLASDIGYLCSMLGKAYSITYREREDGGDEYRLEISNNPHKLLQGVPTPSKLLKETRNEIEISMKQAASELGYSSKSSISNLEKREYETVKRRSLQKIAEYYRNRAKTKETKKKAVKLSQIANSDLLFDRVEKVKKIAEKKPNYDLEVQPNGQKIENFLGGHGGIFLSNTAGYIDPGFEGDITLEIQNLGNAPVKLYPEDRVCQVVFETMTDDAENPYGEKKDTKYMGQTGATGSRLEEEQR